MTSNSSPSFLQRFSQIFNRPPPKRYGNGRNDSEVDPKAVKVGILQELASQAKRTPENLHLLIEALSLKVHGGYEDDSKYIVLPRSEDLTDDRWNNSFNLLLRCLVLRRFKLP
jgi:hypothetical protein